jgi:hypothetical protein
VAACGKAAKFTIAAFREGLRLGAPGPLPSGREERVAKEQWG